MKERIQSSLTGNLWWKPFLGMIALIVVTMGSYEGALSRLDGQTSPEFAVASLLFAIVMLLAYAAVIAAFTIVLLRLAIPTVTYREKAFSFDGKAPAFVKLILLGSLLSAVTLGFYAPWFMRRYEAYLIAHTEYDGERPRFLGKGGKLLKYGLLSFVLPFAVLLGVFFTVIAVIGAGGHNYGPEYSMKVIIATVAFDIVCFFALLPYEYLVYRWTINISWKNKLISWHTDFWSAVGFLAGQLALTVITLGVYWPAFVLRATRYFAAKTVITDDAKELGRFGFEAPLGKGFLLLWGQTLLCILTLGIYAPWAYAKIVRFMANGLFYETAE